MTLGFFGLANLLTYKYMKYTKCQTTPLKSAKYQVAFGSY
jgi:hypothetical protein